jgi:fructose-bisphosphate aldolase class II
VALISLRQMLDHAAEYGYGIPAFNVNNLEQMRAIMEAADKTRFTRHCASLSRCA